MIWKLLFLFAAGVAIASLAWSTIKQWFEQNTLDTTVYGELIKTKLRNGDYSVIGGVFNKNGIRTAKNKWTAKDIDYELKNKFGNRDKIIINI